MEVSTTGLRVLVEVAELGSFSAAAAALGYTQSAVSRQIAGLERACGAQLFDRRPGGVALTDAGRTMVRHARGALDSLDAAARELASSAPPVTLVRLGAFITAGAVLVPRVLRVLHRRHPDLHVTTRDGTTPALIRGLRSGSLDAAVLAAREPFGPPDAESPPLVVAKLGEGPLLLALPALHPLAAGPAVPFDRLAELPWIASPLSGADPTLGVWPGLASRPRIVHTARDWLTKLELVAVGEGVTTISAILQPVVPSGVRVLPVSGGTPQRRQLRLVRPAGPPSPVLADIEAVLRQVVGDLVP